ncbi:MAG: hypothetical protein GF350_04475 [Chitinivibrionales bacterium]|nr:hypothetical protein [Chitinivibrionales bacterium]
MNVKMYAVGVLCAVSVFAAAAQTTPYVLIDFPLSAVTADTVIKIAWAGTDRTGGDTPDSGNIYYSRYPNGSSIEGRNKVVVKGENLDADYNRLIPGSDPAQRMISFRPDSQVDMSAGVFYYIVAFPFTNPLTMQPETLYSNELQMIIETKNATVLTEPSDSLIPDLTPTFEWEVNAGVPYYHVLLSDEKIEIDSSSESGESEFDIQGLSIVWQAITPNTQIVYGAPDPSGTITAAPPPLSPGKTYSVVVLNNYGNHPAYTSTKFGLPKIFTIEGDPDDTLRPPRNIFPAQGDSLAGDTIQFKWTNLDAKANTYKIYVYVASDEIEGVTAQMAVWDNEISAGDFDTSSTDTAYTNIDARYVLTKNHYTWKVIAIDERGAGRAGDTTGFDYGLASGKLRIETKELITSGTKTVTSPVGLVEIEVDVLDGSLENPLLFYTDDDGVLSRDRPVGTYRITAVKSGFNSVTKTLTIAEDSTTELTIYLERPDATIFGSVVDKSGGGINLATVYAASDQGDTISDETNTFGSFELSCYEGDWDIWAQKTGYVTSLTNDTSASSGGSINYGAITLTKVPFSVSGTVKNSKGQEVIGANVKLYKNGVLVDEVPSTSQDGSYSFAVEAGTYKIYATRTGFVTFSKTYDITSSRQIAITMQARAVVVKGYIFGRTRVGTDTIYSPVTSANVYFIESGGTGDTLLSVSDPKLGDFELSLTSGKTYLYWATADGYVDGDIDTIQLENTGTTVLNDTIRAYASLSGTVQQVDPASGAIVDSLNNVAISLINLETDEVFASEKTDPAGAFEILNIPDGDVVVSAGKEGYVVDTVIPGDTIEFVDGAPINVTTLVIDMVPGEKAIAWSINAGQDTTSTIKMQSPIKQNLSPDTLLNNVGSGSYRVIVDAVADSILDLAKHVFTVPDSVDTHTESMMLPVSHSIKDTLHITNDQVQLTLASGVAMDSAYLLHKPLSATAYDTLKKETSSSEYVFEFIPLEDGTYLEYYFIVYIGTDRYGYVQEAFQSYVTPNTKLSKIEIVPSSEDTLLFPADYQLTLRFKGYYGSSFIIDTTIPSNSSLISWDLSNPQGCQLAPSRGTQTVVNTPQPGVLDTARSTVTTVTVTVDDSLMKTGSVNTATIHFDMLRTKLDSVGVRRVDPQSPNPLSTAEGNQAEFVAAGYDAEGNSFSVTPLWQIYPASAGTINENGTFIPAPGFAGWVAINALAGDTGADYVVGEYNYNTENPKRSGLQVQKIVVSKPTPDTINTFQGCTIILPDSAVGSNETGLLQVGIPSLDNLIERGVGDLRMIGSAYDITEVNGVTLPAKSGDTINLSLDIPVTYQTRAVVEENSFYIARWNEDSLEWDTLGNSVVNEAGTGISAVIHGFSRYAVLAAAASKTTSGLRIIPNPFSPHYSWQSDEFADLPRPPANSQGGAWIIFSPDSRDNYVQADLRIFNILGDMVYYVSNLSVAIGDNYVWWDGKKNDRQIELSQDEQQGDYYFQPGDRMCRNGRYIVVLSIKDSDGKIKHYKKQAILIK